MVQLGMDPVQFGIVLMVNLGIGLVTPPVGTVLFVGCAVGGVKMEDTVRTIWPFYVVMVATLLLVTYIPAISMFIPKLLMG
jgi:TRAP-type C4-dicarboxylate transport system permease large subunit